MGDLLRVWDVVSGYGEVPVLRGVNIHLTEGEIVTIIGPNGAGKSTLIKTIFGLLRPTEGTIRFRGIDITGTAPEELVVMGMSYVPQLENTFPSLTVRENLEMGAYILNVGLTGKVSTVLRKALTYARFWEKGNGRELVRERLTSTYVASRGELESRLERVLGLFPALRPRLREKVKNLSGGQQQMVALARTLMLDPSVMLIDEPSAGLAPNLVDLVFDKIREINEAGTSIVLVEQNAKKALRMADRGYVLEMGRNRYEDTGQALLENPEVGRLYLGG